MDKQEVLRRLLQVQSDLQPIYDNLQGDVNSAPALKKTVLISLSYLEKDMRFLKEAIELLQGE